MRKGSVKIEAGQRTGILTIGDLVAWVQDHPYYHETPLSYLQQGRLYECHCDCGNIRLYSENVLSSGQIKSCGCLRTKKRLEMHNKREIKEARLARKRQIAHEIGQAQARLRFLQNKPVELKQTPEVQNEITTLATELRRLFALKTNVARKYSNWQDELKDLLPT